MRNDGKFKKELNINDSAKYINMLFSLSQVMKNSGSTKLNIKTCINIALEPLLEVKFINKYKLKK